MKENSNTVVENALDYIWHVLTKIHQIDSEKAKKIIKEEVDYLINTH